MKILAFAFLFGASFVIVASSGFYKLSDEAWLRLKEEVTSILIQYDAVINKICETAKLADLKKGQELEVALKPSVANLHAILDQIQSQISAKELPKQLSQKSEEIGGKLRDAFSSTWKVIEEKAVEFDEETSGKFDVYFKEFLAFFEILVNGLHKLLSGAHV